MTILCLKLFCLISFIIKFNNAFIFQHENYYGLSVSKNFPDATLACHIKIYLFLPKKDKICLPSDNDDTKPRYLLYDVNPGEGFNLRRDVYLRVSSLVHKLNDYQLWVLVLPPWGNLYHWKNEKRSNFHPWQDYFDLLSISKWIPVIELEDFLKGYGNFIDAAFVLQHYAEGWGEKYEEKYDARPCVEQNNYWQTADKPNSWKFHKWEQKFKTQNFTCFSFQGQSSTIIPLMQELNDSRSILLDRAETLLHDEFGSASYWAARRSMRFSRVLIEEANYFRKYYLMSDDKIDKTESLPDWRNFKPLRGSAIGGPYLAVHLRRRDFIYARRDEVPDIKSAAEQLQKLLRKLKLKILYVATDAPDYELEELRRYLKEFSVYAFKPKDSFFNKYGDGGVAIIDQIICTYARYFIGTYESTFSFRIQEEREILGFPVSSTFNRLCGKNPKCEPPSKWTIVY